MKVLVDMDGVLNDLGIQVVNKITDKGYKFDPAYDYKYHLEGGILNSKGIRLPGEKQKAILKEIFFDQSFWRGLNPLPGSQDCLKWINDNYDVFIATTPFRFTEAFKGSKIAWLELHYPFIKTSQVIFSAEKWKLDGDVIIEDKAETLEECKKVGMVTIAYDQLYNLDCHCDYRLEEWDINTLKQIFGVD